MSSVNPTLITIDNTKAFNAAIDSFKKDAVLVGVPAQEDNRTKVEIGEDGKKHKVEDKESSVNNAFLLAINVFGSPVNNIPPRDVMSTGIYNATDAIAAQFKIMAQNVLSKGKDALEVGYSRIGIIASNSIKKAINDQDSIAPPAESTLISRRAKGFKGTKALIVSGQLRNSITWVLNNIWGGR